jgi:hypothetical protein
MKRAVRFKPGWFWFDRLGKGLGPFATKSEAEIAGIEHSLREEKIVKMEPLRRTAISDQF